MAQVQYIKKGQVAPYDGYLFTPKKEMEVRKVVEENKLLKRKELVLSDLQTVYEDKSKYFKKIASEAQNEAVRARVRGDVKGVLGFVVCVVITGAISYAALKAVK